MSEPVSRQASGRGVTSLIPAFFGIVLVLFGILARTEDSKKRMLWMHIAVTVGLIGFVMTAARAIIAYTHPPILRPLAVREEVLMAAILLIYVYLCVRSFIAARKARLA